MKRVLTFASLTLMIFFLSGQMRAGDVAHQTINFEVQPINELSVDGNPSALVAHLAPTGQDIDTVCDYATTYAITTNCAQNGKKITAAIDADMPSGVSLIVLAMAPTGASSSGGVSLSTSPEDIVTDIDAVAESGISIYYCLAASVSAGVLTSDTRTVTLTLADTI